MGGQQARPRSRSERDRIVGLCAWFAREARDLPWRRRRTGYRALVAEAMLQQTQVARVVDRYRAFAGLVLVDSYNIGIDLGGRDVGRLALSR